MNSMLKKAGLSAALAATALTTAMPAQAQRYHGGYRGGHHGGDAGPAIVAGIAGLAIGAALASDHGDRDRYYRERGYNGYYDDGYYRSHGYYPNNGYYAYRYRSGYDCWVERRWDPYVRHNVRIRVCR